MFRKIITVPAAFCACLTLNVAPAGAQDAQSGEDAFSFKDRLTQDWGGVRRTLAEHGVDFQLTDQNEFWAIPVGGSHPSNNYIGVTTGQLSLDLGRLTHLPLGTLGISGVDIRGHPFSNQPLYVFNQVSGIEADINLRLYEVWYGQTFDHDRLDLRVGKLDLSHDFMGSDGAQQFMNASFSWPMVPDNNLYDQGPAAPLGTPALRLKYALSHDWTVLAAVADDNPIGASFLNEADPWNQNQDPSGTRFHFGTGALMFLEAQYHTKLWGRDGTYKLGGYGDTGRFPDQADSSVRHKGNWTFYAVADQELASLSGAQTLAGFVRATWAPPANRNQIANAVDAGLVLNAPFQRADDVLALGFGYGEASPVLRRAERRAGTLAQHAEYHLELTYQFQATRWLLIQPDLQGMLSPSGGVLDTAGRRVKDEAIFGLHSSVSF
ncbi:carbohydrate porin [Acetobacter persici]|uniref:carbohydrate porin n=1 Tax=Acetobacter persici TaxID=1076596 RepID=UPI001FCBC0F6|nr:carbohydrate porin [Acetobacter persici]